MTKYMFIEKVCNSFGAGYVIGVEIGDFYAPRVAYYGYSKKDAIRKYREKFDIIGRHFVMIEY